MLNITFTLHQDISDNLLDEIISLKSVAWPYPYEEHKKWLNNNLKACDLHVLLSENKKYMAYLNLIDIEVKINKKTHKLLGLGNVCTLIKGKGYGRQLMQQTNQYMKNNKKTGLLFCKKPLDEFYNKTGWSLIDKKKIKLAYDNKIIETMIYNNYIEINTLSYKGKLF